VDTRFHR